MTQPPVPVRVAAGLWLATAVFAVLTAISLWVLRGELASRAGVPASDLTGVLVTVTVVTVVFAAVYFVLVRKLYQARKWSRGALSAVGVVHMLWLFITGVSASSLVTLLIISIAVVFTWQRRAAQWMAEVGT